MNHLNPKLISTILTLMISHSSTHAAVIFQSALPGGYGTNSGVTIGGYSGSGQIFGAAFSISQSVHVDSIGGLFFSNPENGTNDIFGAIVRLSDEGALPVGDPFDSSEVVGSVVFNVESVTATDVLATLSLDLVAGHYAVLFGSGYFGATGIAATPDAGGDLSARFLIWNDNYPGGTSWHDSGNSNKRLVVLGTIPEPSAALLVAIGVGVTLRRRSVRNTNMKPKQLWLSNRH